MADGRSEEHRRQARAVRARPAVAARLRRDWWWIAILLICGGFQIYRGAPIDGAFFLAAGAALLADAAGLLSSIARYRLPRLHLIVQIVLGTFAVAVITFAPQFGIADLVVVGVIGATAILVAWRDDDLVEEPKDEDASLRRALRRSAILWSVAGVALCLWELSSFFLAMPSPQAELAHPPLSDLIDPIVANPFGRALCAAAWVLGGAMLLRRGRRS
jgi:hypothetical protein